MVKKYPSDSQLLTEIYHDINDVVNLLGKMRSENIYSPQINDVDVAEKRLHHIHLYIVETMVNKVIEQVMEEQEQKNGYPNLTELNDQRERNKEEIILKEAEDLIHRVEQKAASKNLSVVIAVFSPSANPIAVHCMNHSYIASYDIAVNKAFTSAALKMSTSDLQKLSQPGKELYGIQFTNQGRIVIFGGGEPLYYKNKLVGAIGVSGASETEDTALAKYGKDILEEVINW